MRSAFFWTLIIFSGILLVSLSYFSIRNDFANLMIHVSGLFLIMAVIWKFWRLDGISKNLHQIQWAGIFLRLLLLFCLPILSDDYFRFLWDGSNFTEYLINPYLNLPSEIIEVESTEYSKILFNEMNSQNYYSVYPPLDQFIFSISTFLFPSDIYFQVLFIKLLLLVAEGITIVYLPKLLSILHLNSSLSILYILNPLVIIEGVGNLHFEVLTIMLLCLFLYYLFCEKWVKSAIYFGAAVGIKLLPLILIPALIMYLGFRKSISYLALSLFIFVLPFFPFVSVDIMIHIFSSIELYFQSFEFNASIYYLVRAIGFQVKGYNIIQTAGLALSVTTFLLAAFFASKVNKGDKKQFLTIAFYTLLVYYFLSTTIHPWYIINLLFFSLITFHYRSVVVWTFLIFISYHVYATSSYNENLYLVLVEYFIFIDVMFYEFYLMKRKKEVLVDL